MMTSKRKYVLLTAAVLAILMLAGCGGKQDSLPSAETAAPAASPEENAQETPAKENPSTVFTMPGGESLISGYGVFSLDSENLNNGVWDDVISNTSRGQNKSPQLSWEMVDGAESYVIYMVDTSTQYWMHWKSEGVTETSLELGWAGDSDYVGPYPPSGSEHMYEIYVIALKGPVERVKGGLDSTNIKFPEFIEALDTDESGNTGNIIACGNIAGTFCNK